MVQAGLEVRQVRNSYVVAISHGAPDPETAAAFANGAAKLYVDEKLGTKLRGLDRASGRMNERLRELLGAERSANAPVAGIVFAQASAKACAQHIYGEYGRHSKNIRKCHTN